MIAITGATGYIGHHLVLMLQKKKQKVLLLTRKKPCFVNAPWLPYDLCAEGINLPIGVKHVIHLAANTKSVKVDSYKLEISAAKRLLGSCNKVGAKFIFISSQSARENASSDYGRIKWEIEQLVLENDGIIIRPGLVYGGIRDGLYGKLCALTKGQLLFPAFYPSPKVQLIHLSELCIGIYRCLTEPNILGLYCLACEKDYSFNKLIKIFGLKFHGTVPLFFPVPQFLVSGICQIIGSKNTARLGLSQLKSLLHTKTMQTKSDLQLLNLDIKNINSHKTFSRKLFLLEAYVFFNYLNNTKPSRYLLKKYLLVIENTPNIEPLPMPSILYKLPCLMPLLEHFYSKEEPLNSRLSLATKILETSALHINQFIQLKNQSRSNMFLMLSKIFFVEIAARVAAFPFAMIHRVYKKIYD